MQYLEHVLDTKAKLARKLIHEKGINLIGISTYFRGDYGLSIEDVDKYCIVIHVSDYEIIRKIPTSVEDVPIVIDVVPRFHVLSISVENDPKSIIRPVEGGVSVSSVFSTAGTITITSFGLVYSCNHVLAYDYANCRYGYEYVKKHGKVPILQPGSYDLLMLGLVEGNCREDPYCGAICNVSNYDQYVIGYLWKYVRVVSPLDEPQVKGLPDGYNLVDCAVGKLVVDYRNNYVMHIGEIVRLLPPSVSLIGTQVVKMGRTTGLTIGTVKSVHADIKVFMGEENYALFTDQVLIVQNGTTPFSKPGDSGSPVIHVSERSGNALIGILHAGGYIEGCGYIGLSCPAIYVEKLLGTPLITKKARPSIVTEQAKPRKIPSTIWEILPLASLIAIFGISYVLSKH